MENDDGEIRTVVVHVQAVRGVGEEDVLGVDAWEKYDNVVKLMSSYLI